MAKKTKDIQNGDVKSNIVVLRSVYGKVGQKYFIQPQRDPKTGRFPACVKRVNSQGDIILTPEELDKEARGEAAYIKEDKVFFNYTAAVDNGRIYIKSDNPYVKYDYVTAIQEQQKKPKRWNIGFQTGLGFQYGMINRVVDVGPYIGVGVSWGFGF